MYCIVLMYYPRVCLCVVIIYGAQVPIYKYIYIPINHIILSSKNKEIYTFMFSYDILLHYYEYSPGISCFIISTITLYHQRFVDTTNCFRHFVCVARCPGVVLRVYAQLPVSPRVRQQT